MGSAGMAYGSSGNGSSNVPGYEEDASKMWSGMMADNDASLAGALKGTYADEALSGRRMNEMNALGGGGMGGAFAGGLAQTAIGGEQARLKAKNDNLKQGLELKMARLQQLIRQAEAGKDRNLQRELQAEADKTQLAIAGMATGGQQQVEDPNMGKGIGGGPSWGDAATAVNLGFLPYNVAMKGADALGLDTPSTKNWDNPSEWDLNPF